MTGACTGAVTGAADGFMWGAIGGAVTGGMNSPHCFVAGTLVCTIDGEEFTTTEGYPFYTLERGFVKAGELRYSDTLMDDEGNKLHLEKKNKEHLSEPVTVYNFAVEDYHTYFVGENDVLVHNMCATSNHSESIPLNQDNKINTPDQSALIKLAKEAKC